MDSYIKSLFDFIKEIFQFRFISEIPKLFFQPRNFFSKIENEDDKTTFKRVLFYAFFYWIIIYILQITFLRGTTENFAFKIIGSLIYDISIFAILVSPLLMLLKFVKPKVSIKTFISFLLLLRFNFIFFFLLFHILFIVQENYLFAAFKWLAICGYYILLIFAFPFIFSFGLVNRLKLIVVAATTVFITTFMYTEISFKLKLNWKYDFYLLFGDPIGEEVETTRKKFEELISNEKTPQLITLDSLLKSSSSEISKLKDSMIIAQKYYASIADSQKSLMFSVNFTTTREFLQLQTDYINSMEYFYEKYYDFIIKLKRLQGDGILLQSLKNEVDEGFRNIDSLYPKISYIFGLNPHSDELKKVSKKDTRLFREFIRIGEKNNRLAEIYISIQDDYHKLQNENQDLFELHFRYMDKLSSFLDIKIFFYKFHIIAPNPN